MSKYIMMVALVGLVGCEPPTQPEEVVETEPEPKTEWVLLDKGVCKVSKKSDCGFFAIGALTGRTLFRGIAYYAGEEKPDKYEKISSKNHSPWLLLTDGWKMKVCWEEGWWDRDGVADEFISNNEGVICRTLYHHGSKIVWYDYIKEDKGI